jgi:hypothetical protein
MRGVWNRTMHFVINFGCEAEKKYRSEVLILNIVIVTLIPTLNNEGGLIGWGDHITEKVSPSEFTFHFISSFHLAKWDISIGSSQTNFTIMISVVLIMFILVAF